MHYDDYAVQFFDEEHSDNEERLLFLGMSLRQRVLVVCHCERGDEGEVIRLISAGRATKREAGYYEGPK